MEPLPICLSMSSTELSPGFPGCLRGVACLLLCWVAVWIPRLCSSPVCDPVWAAMLLALSLTLSWPGALSSWMDPRQCGQPRLQLPAALSPRAAVLCSKHGIIQGALGIVLWLWGYCLAKPKAERKAGRAAAGLMCWLILWGIIYSLWATQWHPLVPVALVQTCSWTMSWFQLCARRAAYKPFPDNAQPPSSFPWNLPGLTCAGVVEKQRERRRGGRGEEQISLTSHSPRRKRLW